MTGQPRWLSLGETVTTTVIGFVIAMVTQAWVMPYFGFTPSLLENFKITLVFMLVSLVRAYVVRRGFDHLQGWIERRHQRKVFKDWDEMMKFPPEPNEALTRLMQS